MRIKQFGYSATRDKHANKQSAFLFPLGNRPIQKSEGERIAEAPSVIRNLGWLPPGLLTAGYCSPSPLFKELIVCCIKGPVLAAYLALIKSENLNRELHFVLPFAYLFKSGNEKIDSREIDTKFVNDNNRLVYIFMKQLDKRRPHLPWTK